VKFSPRTPPRRYAVGHAVKGEILDCGAMALAADEQITFTTEDGSEHDVTRKSFGFYATQSLNARLPDHGLRPVLLRSLVTNRYFIFLVERGKDEAFHAYVAQEQMEIVSWLDTTEALERIRAGLREAT
jgi:hypothetical protein